MLTEPPSVERNLNLDPSPVSTFKISSTFAERRYFGHDRGDVRKCPFSATCEGIFANKNLTEAMIELYL